MSDEGVDLTGDIFDTTAAEIARALAVIPDARVELSTEVELEGEKFSFVIYPLEPVEPTSRDFLVRGNLWLDGPGVSAFLSRMCAALDDCGIAFDFEVRKDGEPDEFFRGKSPRKSVRLLEDRATTPAGTLDAGHLIVGAKVRTGAGEEVSEGWFVENPKKRLLITQGGEHPADFEQLRARFALVHEGIAPLVYLGAGLPPFDDAIVEEVNGSPASFPIAERELAVLGARLAAIVARVHAAGSVLGGIRPELVYVDGHEVQLVPRGPAFLAETPLVRGLRCYYVPYLAPEQVLASELRQASDVFALCATLYFLGTGKHPFGDPEQLSELVTRIITGASEPWPGSPELGQILAAGMSVDAAARPTAAELAEQLTGLGSRLGSAASTP